jgi:DNA polymerase III subunit epsilon
MYAIVDIETTGTYAAANSITEISIQVFDGNRVVEKFETLVNPKQPIPRYIQAFTGITNEMVQSAPPFAEVAETVYTILHNKIFVAHNVNFDYSFIKGHLAEEGYNFSAKKLCTVRLSRKIFPGFRSYSLGNLCQALSIQLSSRHRAGGDADATVQVFEKLLQNDNDQFIEKSLQRTSKEQCLPPNVPKEEFDKLPLCPGVYYFHDQKGKVIYVGKALNIRSRVNNHFSNNSESRQKQNFIRHTYNISFHPCATELMACILESSEIKRLWPVFNYSQKRWEDEFGIFMYEDQNGYLRLAIEKNKKQIKPVHTFHYLVEGHAILRKLIERYNLCPKLCFLQTDPGLCEGIKNHSCFGACEQKETPIDYNQRLLQAIDSLSAQPSYAIVDKGLRDEEQSCILVVNGKLYGMGYIPRDVQVMQPDEIKDFVQQYKENSVIRNLLYGYTVKNPSKVRLLA